MNAVRQNKGLISVPAGRFVAVALLSLQIKHLPLTLRFRADKTFVVAVVALSHR